MTTWRSLFKLLVAYFVIPDFTRSPRIRFDAILVSSQKPRKIGVILYVEKCIPSYDFEPNQTSEKFVAYVSRLWLQKNNSNRDSIIIITLLYCNLCYIFNYNLSSRLNPVTYHHAKLVYTFYLQLTDIYQNIAAVPIKLQVSFLYFV